jgi:hypothetical protein
MDLMTAEKTRAIRFYEWAEREMARELHSGFPSLNRPTNGVAAAAASLLRQMPDDERAAACAAMVRTRHARAIRFLGQTIDYAERRAAVDFILNVTKGEGVAIAALYEEDRGLPPGGLVSWESWGRFQQAWHHRPLPAGEPPSRGDDTFTRWMIQLLESPEGVEETGRYIAPAQADPIARSLLEELRGAGHSGEPPPRLDRLAKSVLRELEAAGYRDDKAKEAADAQARATLEKLKAAELARRMTAQKLEALARPLLDAYALQRGGVPGAAVPVLVGVGWEYRLHFGDWRIATRVNVHGTSGATIGYKMRIARMDQRDGDPDDGLPPSDIGECSLLDLAGLYCEYWTAYTDDQATEALRLMQENWDRFFEEIPPLLADLTID